ncbi:uncharacterized protein K02A2.6-like [Pomacea canaliculata]|uniref:uncharacterized protein K02A2.6-like n=1 Tax=Pomacea canaliculata TaxID=400727 RepID=UPI000D73B311|nr:uncharacterized protein K02A2.6-like [Pomacea canaliculata]
MKKEVCPAWGQTCSKCQRQNHFAVRCPKKSVRREKKHLYCAKHSISSDESSNSPTDDCFSFSSEEELVSAIGSKRLKKKLKKKVIKARMIIAGTKVACQVDSGASVNVIPEKYAKHAPISPTKTKLTVYNGTSLAPKGKTILTVKNPMTGKSYHVRFLVVEKNLTPLLGKKTSEKMGLITVNYENFESVDKITTTPKSPVPMDLPSSHILDAYPDLFSETQGNLPGVVHLEVDPTVPPVTAPSGRVPRAMKDKLSKELKRLTKRGVITPVDQPTDWVSRMVLATKKSGKLRVCIDPRPLNKALKRERYPLPIMEDILQNLANAKLFSKLDLTDAYWHVHLDEESSLLTTFQTPYGRYRWKRLPFGTCVSSELFQKRLNIALEGLHGVIGVSEDIVIYGSGHTTEESSVDHDKNLIELLNRCR